MERIKHLTVGGVARHSARSHSILRSDGLRSSAWENRAVSSREVERGAGHGAERGRHGRRVVPRPGLVVERAKTDGVTVAEIEPVHVERERQHRGLGGANAGNREIALATDRFTDHKRLTARIGVHHPNPVLVAILVGVAQSIHHLVGPAGAGHIGEREREVEVVDLHPALRRSPDVHRPDHDSRFLHRNHEPVVHREVRTRAVARGATVLEIELVALRLDVRDLDLALRSRVDLDIRADGIGQIGRTREKKSCEHDDCLGWKVKE